MMGPGSNEDDGTNAFEPKVKSLLHFMLRNGTLLIQVAG